MVYNGLRAALQAVGTVLTRALTNRVRGGFRDLKSELLAPHARGVRNHAISAPLGYNKDRYQHVQLKSGATHVFDRNTGSYSF